MSIKQKARIFEGKRILITGGTGSLGRKLVSRILSGETGLPSKVTVFSRDEAKQQQMRLEWKQKSVATDEIIYRNSDEILEFRIGDIRDLHSVMSVLKNSDIVINAAALKQVPTCEYFPYEAVQTNIQGAYNIVAAIANNGFNVDTIVGVSTDKACKPVNIMGMTKAIQERIFIEGNLKCPGTRFICVRYGNVLFSRGSVVPLFIDQIRRGEAITLTTMEMTRFLLSLDKAVDTIFDAIRKALPGEIFVPKIPSARIAEIANALIGNRIIERNLIGIRPGEKVHEVLISEEECSRTVDKGKYYVIQPILPELRSKSIKNSLKAEYTSADKLMNKKEIEEFLIKEKISA